MEEVESSSNINNLLSRLRALAVRKLVGISTISTYNSHADCTKMVIFANQQDGHLKKFLSSWQELWDSGPRRSCWGVCAHFRAPTLIHLEIQNMQKRKKKPNVQKIGSQAHFSAATLILHYNVQDARYNLQFAACAHLWAETLTHLPDWDMLWQSDTGCTCDFIIDPVALMNLQKCQQWEYALVSCHLSFWITLYSWSPRCRWSLVSISIRPTWGKIISRRHRWQSLLVYQVSCWDTLCALAFFVPNNPSILYSIYYESLYSFKFSHVLQVFSSKSSQTSTPSLFAFVFLPASCFYNMVGVRAVGGHGDVVAMDAELAVVLIKGLQGGHVGSSLDHLIHPLYRSHHAVPGSI